MKPRTKDKKASLTPAQRRLGLAIDRQIRTYARMRTLLHLVDADVLAAGRMLFRSDRALALWLCEPVHALGDKTPLRQMRTAAGRRQVADVLRSIGYGNFL